MPSRLAEPGANATNAELRGSRAEGEHGADAVEEVSFHRRQRGTRLHRARVGETDAATGDDGGELLAHVRVRLEHPREGIAIHFEQTRLRHGYHGGTAGLAGEDRP